MQKGFKMADEVHSKVEFGVGHILYNLQPAVGLAGP